VLRGPPTIIPGRGSPKRATLPEVPSRGYSHAEESGHGPAAPAPVDEGSSAVRRRAKGLAADHDRPGRPGQPQGKWDKVETATHKQRDRRDSARDQIVGGTVPGSGDPAVTAARLARLDSLKEQGLLAAKDYEMARRALLGEPL
jgi:hypothetical protein